MPEDMHVLDLIPAFVLGSLDSDETTRVEKHLLSCVICRDEESDFQSVGAQLGLVVPDVVPSTDLKDRLMKRVQMARKQPLELPKLSSRSWLERLLPVWGLASLVLIIAMAGINLLLWQRLNHANFFTSPNGMRAVPLSPPTADSEATGFVLISMNGDSGALVVDGLPPLGESQQYQLWLIHNGEKTSGAIFSTDEKNYGGTRIRVPGSLLVYSAVDITIEPAGGSPQPTGMQVLGGPLFNP